VDGHVVVDVPKSGVLTPPLVKIVYHLGLNKMLGFEEGEGRTELFGGEGEAFLHVIVAEEFVVEQDINEADCGIVVEGAGDRSY